ncbi:MAG: aldo/keto reductase [Firmicutes bacterium]|nr:aldo/keto reductase [Bacillota bacterium]
MDKVRLGNTDLVVSKVGFGVLTMGESRLNLPLDEGAELIRYALNQGINLFDTAENHGTYKYLKTALENTNYEPIISGKSLKHSYDGMNDAIEEARRELNRDVIDIFMLQELTSVKEYTFRAGAIEALVDAKAAGKIRYIGVSTHHVDVAEMVARKLEIDVLFPLINYVGLGIRDNRAFDGTGNREDMAAAIRKAASEGKAIFGMKAFGGGNLTGSYKDALDYVYGLKGIQSMILGFGKKSEIDDIVAYLDGTMDREYVPDISKKRIFIDHSDC